MRQDVQITFVLSPSFVRAIQFFQAFCEMICGNRVVVFVIQGFAIPVFRRSIVLAFEVKVADFDILRRFMRIPGVDFVSLPAPLIYQYFRTVRMSLGIIGRWTQIDLRVLARFRPSSGKVLASTLSDRGGARLGVRVEVDFDDAWEFDGAELF